MSTTIRSTDLDALTRDLMTAANGCPLVDISTAARLLGCSATTVRQLIYTGRLVGSRRARNAPIALPVRELARHVLDGRRWSLPESDGEAVEERRERLATARQRRAEASR